MGALTVLLSVSAVAVIISCHHVEAAGTGGCPLPSKVYSCSPKCQQTYDCSHGKACCPNSCNTKSCVDLAAHGNTGGDKYSQSGGTGVYCNNEKCRPSEVCKQDPATRRMKCTRA